MRRSLKLQIFIRLLLVTAVILLANRMLAQQFLTEQLRDQIHHDMGRALQTCVRDFDDRTKFLTCFKDQEKGGLISNVADYFVLCPTSGEAAPESAPNACRHALTEVASSEYMEGDQRIELRRGRVDNEVWYLARQAVALRGSELRVREVDADQMVLQMWALRDRNLIRVLPVVLVMLSLMGWYMSRMVLSPITAMEKSIAALNASNLGQATDLKAPYRELDGFVSVYKNLQVRLADSFNRARRFSSDVSHELRTPLTILRGNTEQLIHDLPTGSDLQVRARTMGDEVERLIDITEKLLMLSRADANSLGRTFSVENLSEMIHVLIAHCQDPDQLPAPFAMSSTIAPDVLWSCDPTLVKLLIHNLLENAQKYNIAQGWIRLSLSREAEQLRLTIENPSANIPSDLETHAFDRFYRGDASHTRQIDGLGLGLSICTEIAKIHQGTLSLSVTEKNTVLLTLTAPLNSAN
jgi:signal transduction histidine kinase